MTILSQVQEVLSPGTWFTSLDVANTYWHIPVHRRFQSFLAVQDGESVLRFRVMLFWLNLAPRVFTKLTGTVAALLADEGFQVLMYLDDWLIPGMSWQEAQAATLTTMNICEHLGFQFNLPKCTLTPPQHIEWDALASLHSTSLQHQPRKVAEKTAANSSGLQLQSQVVGQSAGISQLCCTSCTLWAGCGVAGYG